MSSILGPELEIKGDVKVAGSLLIYGKVFGNIESNGTVRTAKGSVVKGNIKAKDAAISGEVEGDLVVKSKVTLGDTSLLTGNLKSAILTIEEGATFEGVCNMQNAKTAPPSKTD
ncbi:MAG: polymer-forming cytoskeletal protein [Candidatus Marinimicrobia bacterium]|nr:polymer-forming cytoskeletal protein [Candidatus Neomarinimicrobiota bacterium]